MKSIAELNPEMHFDVLSDGELTYDSTYEKQKIQEKRHQNQDISQILIENRRIDELRIQAIEARKQRKEQTTMLNKLVQLPKFSDDLNIAE